MFAASHAGKAAINETIPQYSGLPSAQTETEQKDLSWRSLEFDNNEPERIRDEYVAVSMDQYIVIFGKFQDKPDEQSNPVVYDTKKRVCNELQISPDPILQFQPHYAFHWKENKIIIVLQRRINGPHLEIEVGIITISVPSGAEGRDFKGKYQKLEENLGRDSVQSYTMHLQNDRLYMIAVCELGESDDCVRKIRYLDLKTLKLIEVQGHLTICPFEDHTSYLYQNKIYLYFMDCRENQGTDNEEICIHIDKEVKVNENLVDFLVEKSQSINFSPINCYGFQYQILNGKLYGFLQEENFQVLHVYDIETRVWEKHEIAGQTPAQSRTIILLDNQIYLFGDSENQVWCLSLGSMTKSKFTGDLIKPQFKSESPSNLSSLLKLFLNQAPQHDITFEVKSELIPAHKWWLTQRSKYFANMFSSGMLEAQSQKISIPDVKATTFRAFLEFLYSDHIDLDENLALDLIQQADKYSVPDLKKLCEQCLSVCLSSENYVKIAQLAELLDANSLREAAVSYIAKNVKELKERSDFSGISDHMLKDVIIKITVR